MFLFSKKFDLFQDETNLDMSKWVETRLRTFLEFTFAHIYHLRTTKYYVCAHLEINVCAHF